MNKRAQIPMILLVIIALVSLGATLYAFISFNSSFDTQSQDLSSLTSEIEFNKQYIIAQSKIITEESIATCFSCTQEELKEYIKTIADSHDLHLSGQGNFYGKIRNSEFTLSQSPDSTTLSLSDLFVQSQKGENKIKRNFNLCLVFDNEGNFQENCQT